jgi:hypothetical protein
MTSRTMKIGVVTFWTLGQTNRDDLAAALDKEGLGKFLPEPVTPAVALFNALQELYPDNLIRQLKTPGFAVVDETKGDKDNQYSTLGTVGIEYDDEIPRLEITGAVKLNPGLIPAFRKFIQLLPASAIGKMLATIASKSLRSTMLRPTGGIYWFNGDEIDHWAKVAQAVEMASPNNRVYVIRHDLDADAIKAVHDSLIAEVTADIARLTAEINGGDLKERALRTRETQASALAAKVREYEVILGMGLTELHKSLSDVETAAATAILMASAANPEVANV